MKQKVSRRSYSLQDLISIVESYSLTLIENSVSYNAKGFVDYNKSFTVMFPDGYKSITNIQKIKGHIPEIFSKNNPYTISNIRIWLTNNEPTYRLISNVFTGARDNLEWGKDGMTNFSMSWNDFKSGQRHPLLKGARISQKLRLKKVKAFEECQEILDSYDLEWEVIENQDYKNVNTPLLLINSDGYLSKMSLTHLREGKRPQFYGCDDDLSMYNLYKFVSENTNCRLKEGQLYKGTNEKYIFTCDKHDEFIKNMNECLTSNGKTCCPSCGIEGRSGVNHYRYNPDTVNDRRGLKYNLWRKEVLKKDNFTCQCCGKYGGILNAHHKDGWNWCKARRFDVTNGATLCESCHYKFHSAFGMGDNTEEQFTQFVEVYHAI